MELGQHMMQFMRDYNYFQRNQPPTPPVKDITVHADRVVFNIAKIPRKSFADGTMRPIINEFRIEWKLSYRSRWNTICTNCDNLLGVTFYLQDHKFKNRVTGLVANHWHEYSFFHDSNELYDVRFYAINKSDMDIKPYTFVHLRLLENPPCRQIVDYCNTPPEIITRNGTYLVGNNPQKAWEGHENELCQLTTYNPNTWTFFKPREGWNVDGYLFQNNKWVDTHLQASINTLIHKNQPNDIIFTILYNSHLDRICGDIRQERIDKLKQIIFPKNTEIKDEDLLMNL